MTPDIVADHHAQRQLRFQGSYRIDGPLRRAIQAGWPTVQNDYGIKYGSETLQWFLNDLLDAAQGPFGELLIALADASMARFNMMEDQREMDETFPDWWEIRDIAGPVSLAMARCLAAMTVLTEREETE